MLTYYYCYKYSYWALCGRLKRKCLWLQLCLYEYRLLVDGQSNVSTRLGTMWKRSWGGEMVRNVVDMMSLVEFL